jgi:hypothetical protein
MSGNMWLWPNLRTLLTDAWKSRGKVKQKTKQKKKCEGNQSQTPTEYKEQVLSSGEWN